MYLSCFPEESCWEVKLLEWAPFPLFIFPVYAELPPRLSCRQSRRCAQACCSYPVTALPGAKRNALHVYRYACGSWNVCARYRVCGKESGVRNRDRSALESIRSAGTNCRVCTSHQRYESQRKDAL